MAGRISRSRLVPRDLVFPLQPKQRELLDAVESGKYRRIFYGGAKGGGKSVGSRHVMLIRRMKYPNTTGLFLRRNYKDLNGNHIRPLLRSFPFMRAWYNKSERILTIPEIGSEVFFGHADNEEDINQYSGQEFDDVAVEEATQFTEYQIEVLHQANRGSTKDINRTTWYTSNPGGVSHNYFKRLFIQKQYIRERMEFAKDFYTIRAKVEDNRALLDAQPDYIATLEGIADPMLRRAFREGDWDIYPGQFFETWREDSVAIPPFVIPVDWPLFAAMDYGTANPTSYGVYTVDPAHDVLIRVFGYYSPGAPVVHAENITKMLSECPFLQGRTPPVVYAPPDMWIERHLDSAMVYNSASDVFLTGGFPLQRANNDRENGWWAIKNLLQEGRFKAFSRGNEDLFRTIPHLERATHNPEDIRKPGQEDHVADELRYMAIHFYSETLVEVPDYTDADVWNRGMHSPPTGDFLKDLVKTQVWKKAASAWN